MKRLIFLILITVSGYGYSASQQYQEISLSNRQELRQKFSGSPSINSFKNVSHAISWIGQQSYYLRNKIPDEAKRRELLRMIHYEATRYQLDPDLVLALIEVESGFNRFALSPVGASGLMQVMPFWKELIGAEKDSLFDVRTNLRYGCIILRHYLDVEKNNLERGLARYNGSLGNDTYSSLVLNTWQAKYRYADNN